MKQVTPRARNPVWSDDLACSCRISKAALALDNHGVARLEIDARVHPLCRPLDMKLLLLGGERERCGGTHSDEQSTYHDGPTGLIASMMYLSTNVHTAGSASIFA